MKGIILAGGSGTRLYPLTLAMNKQLLPVYNKPLVYYPLSILLLAGIRELLIIVRKGETSLFKSLLGDGEQLGCSFVYAEQDQPRGLADAFVIGERFIGTDSVALILGDNLFYGARLVDLLQKCMDPQEAIVWAHHVEDPKPYGVVTLNAQDQPVAIEEKPAQPRSNYILVGLYFYTAQVVEVAKNLTPSARGELEITDINRYYLAKNKLQVLRLPRGTTWIDAGNFDNLLMAGQFVQTLEKRQGLQVGCLEEIAYRRGYIDASALAAWANKIKSSAYGQYLLRLVQQ